MREIRTTLNIKGEIFFFLYIFECYAYIALGINELYMHFFGGVWCGVVWCKGNNLFKHSTIKKYSSIWGKKDEGLNK